MTADQVSFLLVAVVVVAGVIGVLVVTGVRPRKESAVKSPGPVAERAPGPVEAPTPGTEPTIAATQPPPTLVEVDEEEAGITRRMFFNRALSAGFFGWLGLMGLSLVAFMWPKATGGFGSKVSTLRTPNELLAEARNADGSVTPVFIPEARAYVVPAPAVPSDQYQGKGVEVAGVMALYQKCVHLGCRVPWCQTSQGFECPCHGSKYNGVGEYFAGPAPRNLDRFRVELDAAGLVIIDTGSIVVTPRAFEASVKYPVGPSCIGAASAQEGEG